MPRLRVSRTNFALAIVALLFISFFLLSEPSYDLDFDDNLDASERGSSPLDTVRSHHKAINQWLSQSDPSVPRGLQYTNDGLVRGWDSVHQLLKKGGLKKKDKNRLKRVTETHPIIELMEQGKKRWDELLERQSKTLPQAVSEYTRRYGRAPPKGFEEWWQFCKRNKVKIVDDRVDALPETKHTAQITLSPTAASSLYGERKISARPRLLFSLLEPIAQHLPADVTFTMSDHDLGSWILGDDQKQAALAAVREGRYLSEADLKPFEKREGRQPVKGLVSACPEGSPGWNRETTFIYDPLETYDFCYNPDLIDQHGALSFDFARDTMLRPIFQLSKFVQNPEFLTTPLEAYENHTSPSAQKKFVPWEEKSISKLFWRGSTTGDSYSKRSNSDYTWHQSHRPRLALMTQATEGHRDVWVRRWNAWEKESWGIAKLNEAYMDIGLTGGPHQCKKEDGTCDEMAAEIHFKDRVQPEQAAKYKYVFDIDGNGWSSRFHRLIMSGSVVVKATIYPEWLSDWMTPWVHYIPCKIDYSDLYDIMSFFAGPPDGRTGGHDELAKQISEQGKKFGEEHWRWEDMQAYMFRLLLEYSRLLADDREEWSYQKTYT
ncbi:hypothetical protein CI109_102725 [Kwoniella shandongensis]|uniref:Glycosyl transferase CAP10 domain-containing protein n=1 Tax=Kwoniella shandongensis TaxID=1734106 RepID=A0AAJ8MUT0_9TREE